MADEVEGPEIAYVLDICETDIDLRLLGFNPFSEADLYNWDTDNVVEAIGRATEKAN